MAKILIKNGRVWNGEQFFYADILTCEDKIVKIERDITDAAEYVFDASGKTVSAGLIDAHMHMKGISTDQYGISAEAVCFPFGVTAAADAGAELGDEERLLHIAVKNKVFVISEIRENKAYFPLTEKLLERYGKKAIGVKVYFDSTGGNVRDTAPLKEICGFASERNLKVMVHCNGSPSPMSELLDCLKSGDILTHAFHGGSNTAEEDNFKSLKEAQLRGVIIDAGFAGHVHTDFSVFKNAVKNGMIPDIISTDITNRSAYMRGGKYGLTMCMSMARDMGMTENDIFRAVTLNPAKALGEEGKWGCLKVGGKADIAVLDYTDEGYSLTDNAGNCIENKNGYRCVLTVSDGQVVYRN